jgi:hypothetical protein
VTVWAQAPGPARAGWAVFTTAFRKIREGSVEFDGTGNCVWDEKDLSGTPVASGLYYLRVEIRSGGTLFQKVEKILILR